MQQTLDDTTAILGRTPAVLSALLRDLPEAWVSTNEGEKTWSVTDVLGHLILADRTNWMTRVKFLLEFGESRPFPAFDRKGHVRETESRTVAELLEKFARVRSQSLAGLHALDLRPEQFFVRGQHPALGVVTISELLAAWAAHDLTHLHQISRTMAHQYREAVGPWNRFLGVMHCTGHSD
jgi:uncharacterized damage-inducible protein DinB